MKRTRRKSRRRKRRKSRKRRRRRRRRRRSRRHRGGQHVGVILTDKDMDLHRRMKEQNAILTPHYFIECKGCGAVNYFEGMWKPELATPWRCGACRRMDSAHHWDRCRLNVQNDDFIVLSNNAAIPTVSPTASSKQKKTKSTLKKATSVVSSGLAAAARGVKKISSATKKSREAARNERGVRFANQERQRREEDEREQRRKQWEGPGAMIG